MASVVVTWAGIYVPDARSVVQRGDTVERIEAYTSTSGLPIYSLDNYPALPQWQGTKLVPRTGIRERLSSNNVYRVRDLPFITKYDPIVVHDMLNRAQRNTLVAFYDAQCKQSFHFLAMEDNVSRNCVFASDGLKIEPVADHPNYYKATVKLLEV